MQDLRLESNDGEYLVLESPDGTTFRLLIDETLRKAVRRETVTAEDSNRISPRDIQLEVRSGVTIEELAQKTGASLEYIEKFAAPVVDELAHVVSSALSVRITMAGDRYNETTQVEFGEVVANRLAASGIVQHSWSARKSDNHGWQLHCRFEDTQATWAFDPRKLLLTPENEAAIGLSAQQSLTESPIPRLRPVDAVVSAPASFEPTFAEPIPPVTEALTIVAEPAQAEPMKLAPVTEIAPVVIAEPAPVATSNTATQDLGNTAEFEGVIPFGRQVPSKPQYASTTEAPSIDSEAGSDLANTADLLDALRKRRIERERDVLAATTGSISIIPDAEAETQVSSFVPEVEVQSQLSATAPIDLIPEPVDFETDQSYPEDVPFSESLEPEKPKKTGRSSMPSWDEIVFNTRHDED